MSLIFRYILSLLIEYLLLKHDLFWVSVETLRYFPSHSMSVILELQSPLWWATTKISLQILLWSLDFPPIHNSGVFQIFVGSSMQSYTPLILWLHHFSDFTPQLSAPLMTLNFVVWHLPANKTIAFCLSWRNPFFCGLLNAFRKKSQINIAVILCNLLPANLELPTLSSCFCLLPSAFKKFFMFYYFFKSL